MDNTYLKLVRFQVGGIWNALREHNREIEGIEVQLAEI